MDIRATIFFAFSKFGWSESYVDVASTGFAASEQKAINLINQRRKCLASNVDIDHVRLSDIAVDRDSRQVEVPNNMGKGGIIDVTDSPVVRVICRCDSTDKYRKTIYIGGVPDGSIRTTNDKLELFDPAKDAIERFLTYLSGNWGFVVRDKDPRQTGNVNIKLSGKIVDIDVDPVTFVTTVTTKDDHNMADNTFVNITAQKGFSRINGIHPIKLLPVPDAKKFRLSDCGALKVRPEGSFIFGGLWRAHQPKAVNIDEVHVERVGKRATGGPFDRPVGRRRTRKK